MFLSGHLMWMNLFFHMTRRLLFLALLHVSMLPSSSSEERSSLTADFPQDNPNALTFVALGDWGLPSSWLRPTNQAVVAKAMGEVAQAVDSKFVLALGDNFYYRGVQSMEDPLWLTAWQARYAHPALNIPWYAILGNHDHYGNAQAQIDFSRQGLDPRWIMPNYFWTVSHSIGSRKIQLVMVDTTLLDEDITRSVLLDKIKEGLVPGEVLYQFDSSREQRWQAGDEQLEWLKSTLASSDADFLLVCGHYPLFSGGEHGNTKSLLDKVKPLLDEYKVDAYLSGHDHTLQHLQSGSVNYYVSGSGALMGQLSQIPEMKFGVVQPGFTVHQVTEDAFKTTFMDAAGKPIYSHSIPRTRSPATPVDAASG